MTTAYVDLTQVEVTPAIAALLSPAQLEHWAGFIATVREARILSDAYRRFTDAPLYPPDPFHVEDSDARAREDA